MGLLSVLSAPLYVIIIYPVYYVAFCAYFLLSLLASPFIYLGSLGVWLSLLPIRALNSIKELLLYLGVASLAGAGIGLLLYSITTLTVNGLLSWVSSFSTTARVKPTRQKRASHGATGALKYTRASDSGVNNEVWRGWELDTGQLRNTEVLSQTILEEDSQDSEF